MRKTCLNSIYELAKQDSRVVFVGSDLGPGVLAEMQAEMPERFYMEGVSEANVIGVAAGLAMEGFIPYVNTIATFLTRRCYEQVALDLCLHNLPVRLIGNGGGVVYAPLGPTHLAVEDIAIFRALPNMSVVAPVDADEMKRFMPTTLDTPGPVYIRLGRGGDPIVSTNESGFTHGKAIIMRDLADITVISTGIMTNRALNLADQLAAEGINCGVVHMHTVKPLDTDIVLKAAKTSQLIVTLEEHTRIGGLGSAVGDVVLDHNVNPMPRVLRLGFDDAFAHDYGRQENLLDAMGLGPEHIHKAVSDAWAETKA
ncbi:MAG: transketolase [Magnetovibrio sp.]|nr:transketolase [Magnetovibrio sp.]